MYKKANEFFERYTRTQLLYNAITINYVCVFDYQTYTCRALILRLYTSELFKFGIVRNEKSNPQNIRTPTTTTTITYLPLNLQMTLFQT